MQLFTSSCRSVAILTGFNLPPVETDGPLGALSLYQTLQALGKEGVSFSCALFSLLVHLVGDEHCRATFQALGVPHTLFSADLSEAQASSEFLCGRIDTLISIEVSIIDWSRFFFTVRFVVLRRMVDCIA